VRDDSLHCPTLENTNSMSVMFFLINHFKTSLVVSCISASSPYNIWVVKREREIIFITAFPRILDTTSVKKVKSSKIQFSWREILII